MFDIIIIGSGPGGYVAAERAGKAGEKVLLIEKDQPGGVCLNWGCIPTKSLLHSAKLYKHALEGQPFGVVADGLRFDLARAMQWKDKTLETLRGGIRHLMKTQGVQCMYEEARLIAPDSVEAGGKVYRGKHIIIATGSRASIPPIPGVEQEHVITNRGAVTLSALPERVAIIGGGVIGLEFASFFSCLGKQVSVFEMLSEVAPIMDASMAAAMRKAMPGISFHLNTRVTKIDGNRLHYSHGAHKTGDEASLAADLVLLAVGRQPNIENLGLEALNIDTTSRGIVVNEQMQTNIPSIYAIGDVTGTSLLAHSASRMGEVAVNTILGKKDRMRLHAIPWAIYTLPEAAGCGLTEQEARQQGYDIELAHLSYAANSRALAEDSGGRAKIILEAGSKKILGIHLMGAYASENIFAAAIILESELRVEEIREIVFPHPSVSEVMREIFF